MSNVLVVRLNKSNGVVSGGEEMADVQVDSRELRKFQRVVETLRSREFVRISCVGMPVEGK